MSDMNKKIKDQEGNKSEGSLLGLLPMGIFLVLFLGTGIITKNFDSMPVNIAFVIASIVAILMNKKYTFSEKLATFSKGAGDKDIILMVLIFLFAGGFANVARTIGAVESTANFGLSLLPSGVLVTGVFLIGCFLATAIGSGMGTIVALTPIAVGIAESSGMPVAIPVAAVVGGAIFGDNLSMISDTTIVAVSSQGAKMKEKFGMNFKMIIPAFIVSCILFYVVGSSGSAEITKELPYQFIKILPYIGVIVLAFTGMNVLIVLVLSILFAGVIGFITGELTFISYIQSISEGMIGMEDMAIIAMIISGMVELIKQNQGIEWLKNFIGARVKNKRGAEFGIATLVSIADVCTQNNTVSIIMAGGLAKEISEEYEIEANRTASILDIFACAIQGIVPYGGQLLLSAGIAGITPMETLKYNYYPYLLLLTGIVIILIGSKKLLNKPNEA